MFSHKGKLNKNNSIFIIAEIGQNHQGDKNLAKLMIKCAKECGADCVKFQKSCLEEKFTKSALNRLYTNKNSFGYTYGEHKKFLEFTDDEFLELKNYAENLNIMFSSSAMDIKSLDFLIKIQLDFIKIGSGDANNFILLEKAAQSNIPLIISTGMQSFDVVKEIYYIVGKYHKNFAFLHCISSYPTPYEDINLNIINTYKKEFPDILIGYSGHELGYAPTLAAATLGAKIIERHITLDKTLKGTDHKASLNVDEFKNLIENIRIIEKSLGNGEKIIQKSELICKEKLGKVLVANQSLNKGQILKLTDINIKVSNEKGLDGGLLYQIIGKKLTKNMNKEEPFLNDYIERFF